MTLTKYSAIMCDTHSVISLFGFFFFWVFMQANVRHSARENRRFASQVLSNFRIHRIHSNRSTWGTTSSRNLSKRIVLGASRFINRGTNVEIHEPRRHWKLYAEFVTPWLLGHDISCSTTCEYFFCSRSVTHSITHSLALSHALIFVFFYFYIITAPIVLDSRFVFTIVAPRSLRRGNFCVWFMAARIPDDY